MDRDIRIVVAIDFGTTFSGFAYANKVNPEIVTNDSWPEQTGVFKTNTVLQYDENWNVTKWGYPALAQEPVKKKKRDATHAHHAKPVELFKLYLAADAGGEMPSLPPGLDFKRAITDYLGEMAKLIKETLASRWPGVRFPQQVRVVLTVPAEWTEEAKAIMRACAFHAGLIETLRSDLLEFTTEPEAAAIHCISILKEHELMPGASFMIVDCGGGTVDLTTRRLLPENQLGEITERSGELCGSSFVDREFLKFLGRKLGFEAMNQLKTNHYGQLQYLVQYFCTKVKFSFNGNPSEFRAKELDIERVCPAVMQYMTEKAHAELDDVDWIVEMTYEDVKKMFDPVVNKIITLIERQLNASDTPCSCMFLVGGFGESQYLQARVRATFGRAVPVIAVPKHPIAAVVRGALSYGLNMSTVKTRVLKWSYGVEVSARWEPGDPPERRTPQGRLFKFHQLARRSTEVAVNQKFQYTAGPVNPNQTDMNFNIYVTPALSAKYCDENGMRMLGKMKIDLPDPHLGKDRLIQFTLTFGAMEVKATAQNIRNGQIYQTTFDLEF
ncbi:9476_t:CDS:10 [Paraglomus brasilianum]|uniref:9476_t:CDS:1 n=1 Tax=Paraglomus brasilianum TaxID=144538 RepID=A0A9N9BHK9_9GLOM|nr:9476_t:CDS:10 [Paraglomus brasilianum]